jgi:hypothetical protein
MISKERKQELVNEFAYAMERYLGKQWIDSLIAESVSDNQEEQNFLNGVNYSIIVQYDDRGGV